LLPGRWWIGPEEIADLVALNNHRRAARIIAAMQFRVSATPGQLPIRLAVSISIIGSPQYQNLPIKR
jgi:hypothetical protein